MNRRQKLVQQQFLNNEETVIKRLKGVYGQSLKDITGKVADLDKSIADLQEALADVDDDEIGDLAKAFLGRRANISPAEAKETLQSMIQSKVYQKRYQEALKGQIDGIVDKLHGKEYKAVSDYLKECYEDGFIGTMFDLQGQGIPLCFPLDQEAMVRAVQLDSKISQGLYSRLGEDVAILKEKITAQISRGIATGMTFQQVARGLSAYTNIGYNNAVRIARTEGHRIQVQGTMDACYEARDRGADIVKQWDSTLDGKTRESHIAVDGEIRELDEKFSNGLRYPSDPHGGAAEVVNCRCALLQKARWATEGGFTKMNNFTKEIEAFESPEDYAEFKKTFFSDENRKYMNYVQRMEEKYETKDFRKVLDSMTDREYKHYSKLLSNNPAFNKQKKPNNPQIAIEISGKSDILSIGDYADFENYISKEYGFTIPEDIKRLDFRAVRESTAGVDYILKEFPQAHDMLSKLECCNDSIMTTSFYGSVAFNPYYYNDYSIVASRSGNIFNDITTAVFSNGSHEAGHLLELAMIRMNGGYAHDWNNCTYSKKVVSEALKNAKKQPDGKGKNVSDLIGEVSAYARQDRSECMAECVSDYSINGEKSALLSKEVWKILKRELG